MGFNLDRLFPVKAKTTSTLGKWCVAISFGKPHAQTNFFICPVPYSQNKTTLNNNSHPHEGLDSSMVLLRGGEGRVNRWNWTLMIWLIGQLINQPSNLSIWEVNQTKKKLFTQEKQMYMLYIHLTYPYRFIPYLSGTVYICILVDYIISLLI